MDLSTLHTVIKRQFFLHLYCMKLTAYEEPFSAIASNYIM